jgi:hypothetical protein
MFYYTNFIQETNVWWLRRVRPVWMGVALIYFYWLYHRYYFFGKEATKAMRRRGEEENIRMANLNKRHFGYGIYYEPTLERSRRKQIMEAMGENYDRAVESEDRYLVIRDFDELAKLRA